MICLRKDHVPASKRILDYRRWSCLTLTTETCWNSHCNRSRNCQERSREYGGKDLSKGGSICPVTLEKNNWTRDRLSGNNEFRSEVSREIGFDIATSWLKSSDDGKS